MAIERHQRSAGIMALNNAADFLALARKGGVWEREFDQAI
jgi:hypothetical protein